MSESFNAKKVVRRRVVARNCIEATMPAPGTDLTIDLSSDSYKQFPFIALNEPDARLEMEPNSNVVVRNLGVYCNFADGLVFANPTERFIVELELGTLYENTQAAIGRSQMTGIISASPSSKTITGTNTLFTSELSVGDIIIARNSSGNPEEVQDIWTIASITNDTAAVLTDYPRAQSGLYFSNLIAEYSVSNIDRTTLYDIGVMNCMNSVDHHLAGFSTIPATSQAVYGIYARPLLKSVIERTFTIKGNGSISFHTDSVASGFEGDNVLFDVVMDIDYTKKESF